MTATSNESWTNWQAEDKLRLYVSLRQESWDRKSRPNQKPPGGEWRTWYLKGGRGCVAAGTLIYDPVSDRHVPVESRTSPGWVQTLSGPRLASASYLKGTAALFRVETETGGAVVVTAAHRFLTPRGWVRLGGMTTGDVIAAGGLTASRADAPRSMGTPERLASLSWTRIVAVTPLGEGAFYDLTVPGEEHYLANGLWHHNSGKSRTGAETLGGLILDYPAGEWAVIAPTFGDARTVCLESDGGLLKVLGPAVSNYNRSTGEVFVANGSKVIADGANDGAERIQGHNLRGAWTDEIGLWQGKWQKAWDESIQFAVRLAPGKIIATGTPKSGHGLVRRLTAGDDPSVVVTSMRTLDNAANLDPGALAELIRAYQGKRLGRQELEAEILEDVEGALWTSAQIEALRIAPGAEPAMRRKIVAVDPNMSNEEAANAGGVIVVGLGTDGKGYVLADRTITSGGPRAWANAAVTAYHEFECDRIVAERNAGGEMVRITIQTVDAKAPVKLVYASRGKRTRAEPVASLYEGDNYNPPQVHHVGIFPELEVEMTTWTPESESPDRMDALVWGLTELLLVHPMSVARILEPTGMIEGLGDRGGGYY